MKLFRRNLEQAISNQTRPTMLKNKVFKNLKEEVETSSNEYKVNEDQINNDKLQSVSPEFNSKDLKVVDKACLPKEEVLGDKS